ncbi:MAG TPA: family 16 glycoside hydrolase [Burkholderiales bacterium]|nr:family 16 glycoside hydrolase [Burkholderiales bacterium]
MRGLARTLMALTIAGAALAACATMQEVRKPAASLIPPEITAQVKATDYQAVRIKKFPIMVEGWTYRRYTFFQTVDKLKALGIGLLEAYPGQPLGGGDPKAVFGEDMPEADMTAARAKLNEAGVSVVAYGVVDLGTTEASMRKVFDFARKMGIRTVVCEPRDEDFPLLEKLLDEYDLQAAIHNHPQPAKYAFPMTAFERLQGRSERIGVCADTGHWMREGLDPVECLRLLRGRILDTHLKDRTDYGKGKSAKDVAWGSGRAKMRDILAELTLQDYAGALTMEYENEEEVLTPEPAIRKSVEFVKSVTYYWDYAPLLSRSAAGYEKHGWNHYGPGYFELDPKTGVLKSQGGMGLLWYSAKTYRDFVLELDFKCSRTDTNSGVFVRVPAVPTSDDYVYHSLEVQIYDAGEGIHATGAAYDAEAPMLVAARPAGEWNHYKITFRGSRLQVELNGQLVLDWEATPRGKVKDLAPEGYIGLQNHDSRSPVYFRDIYIKEL